MYTNNRDAYRQAFQLCWQKYKKKVSLDPYEIEIVKVILEHPQFQQLIEMGSTLEEYAIEENPYIHLSLHMALEEQLRLDRPLGIVTIYQKLQQQYPDIHAIKHKMISCLANQIYHSQTNGSLPDENEYLVTLRKLV